MGAYGSQPVREKVSIDETVGSISYGASSMQGWRLHQEDAHSCCPNFDKETALFAVYDGHGGHEVAQYAAMKYPDFLKDLAAADCKALADCLEKSFLAFDKQLTQKDVIEELMAISGTQIEPGEEPEEDEAAALYEEATMPLEQVLERYKGPLAAVCKKGGQDTQSPAIHAKQERAPFFGGADNDSDSKASNESGGGDDCQVKLNFGKLINGHTDNENNENIEREIRVRQQQHGANNENGTETHMDTSSAEQAAPEPASSSKASASNSAGPSGSSSSSQDPEPGSSSSSGTQRGLQLLMGGDIEDSESEECDESGDDSDDSEEEAKWKAVTKAENKGEVVEEDEEEDEDEEDEDIGNEDDSEYDSEEEYPMDGLKQIEQPGVDSGTTAVVAVLKGKQLHVANAGDSRCIISRAGQAIDMSIDHKPEDEPEYTRISKAGGQVTEDGRVNGGLNLSRALGDHRYKQNTTLPAEEQMVTALPDIKSLTLEDDDEFMVLACDGIWNVMTSQEVVSFVLEKLKCGTSVLSQICEEMFEFCLAPNTEGDGSGCDNMTCIIVLFKPASSFSQQGSSTEDGKRRASSESDGVTFGEMSKKLKTHDEDSSSNTSSS